MPKRRGHGEGSIFKRKDGRWCAELFVGYGENGKKRIWRAYGDSRKEVQEKLTAKIRDYQQGLPVAVSKQTLGQFLETWLEDCVKGYVRPNTYANYKQVLRHFTAIASTPLNKLTPQQVQHLYRQKQDAGLTRTVVLMHAVLHKALDQAVKWGMVPRNIADAVERPRIPARQCHPLSQDEAVRFLEAASEDRLYALYVLAITCGLRFGELLGLCWKDVDLERGTLTVSHQLQTVDGKATLQVPKTAKSRRTIILPAVAIAALKKHRGRQLEERLKLGEAWQDWDLVFYSEIGTPLNESNVRNRSFYPLLEKAGLPRIRFHDLRHTCATLLLAQGVHPKFVQEQLGHSQISVTLDTYSHVTPSMMKDVAAKMDAILSAANTKRR
ncbi:MAG TPA: site-specific integrase [Firmicutes bacterium]|nr:site-specific integrase [Candidatus Fermentithermobacillaceae bacterium]